VQCLLRCDWSDGGGSPSIEKVKRMRDEKEVGNERE